MNAGVSRELGSWAALTWSAANRAVLYARWAFHSGSWGFSVSPYSDGMGQGIMEEATVVFGGVWGVERVEPRQIKTNTSVYISTCIKHNHR